MVAFTLCIELTKFGILLTIWTALMVFRLTMMVFQMCKFLFKAGLRLLVRLRQARSIGVTEFDGRA